MQLRGLKYEGKLVGAGIRWLKLAILEMNISRIRKLD